MRPGVQASLITSHSKLLSLDFESNDERFCPKWGESLAVSRGIDAGIM